MSILKAVLDFIRFTVTKKLSFGRNVYSQMTSDPLFQNPDVPMSDFKTHLDSFEQGISEAKDGGKLATAAMYAAEDVVDKDMRLMAAFVNRVADGDPVIILKSGFNISKGSSSYQKLSLNVDSGDVSGSVKIVAKAVTRARAYVWQMAKDKLPEGDEGWTIIGYSTIALFEQAGLTVATKCYFRMAAITPEGITDYTDPVMKVIE